MKTRLGCLSNKSDSCSDFSEFLPHGPERSTQYLKLSTDEVTKWADSFDILLSNKYGLSAFRAFLKTEFSDENIDFWLACEDYKKIKSPAKMVSKANKIYKEFIDVQSPKEVNIDFRTKEETRQKLLEPTASSLHEIQAKVYSLMEKDSYPRAKGLKERMSSFLLKQDWKLPCYACKLRKPRLTLEECLTWKESFENLLSSKHGLYAFRAFLVSEFSEENIAFYLACKDYKSTKSGAKLQAKAERIYNEFIGSEAPRE
ncbi:Regulator of G-protein signaling 8, partial [Clarias magur]